MSMHSRTICPDLQETQRLGLRLFPSGFRWTIPEGHGGVYK